MRRLRHDAPLSSAVRSQIGTVIADLQQAGILRFDARWPVALLRGTALLTRGVYLLTLCWAPSIGVALGVGVAALALAAAAVRDPVRPGTGVGEAA